MSTIGLTASPQRPYIHELFGSELLLSWPEGQKLHEEAMELYYAGDYSGSLQKLDKAVAEAERFSNAREKDMAILLTTKADKVRYSWATRRTPIRFFCDLNSWLIGFSQPTIQ